MGNLPGSHGQRGFGHGHGPFGGHNAGPFGGQGPGFMGHPGAGQNQPYYPDPMNPTHGGGPQNQDPRGFPGQHPVANVTPPPYTQGNYPQQGYPQQGYPQGQNYPGYGPGQNYPGYQQQGYPGGGYPPQASPAAGLGQAACCGSCMACLTCLLCSCCQGMGGGAMEDDVGEDGNEVPGTVNVSSPRDDDTDH